MFICSFLITMSVSGLIYDSSFSPSRGTVWVDVGVGSQELGVGRKEQTVKFRKLHAGVKFFSNFLVLASLAGMILTMLPVAAMEIKYQLTTLGGVILSEQSESKDLAARQRGDTNIASLDSSTGARNDKQPGPANDMEAFAIHISKINAHSVVVPNVDASDPKIYMEALKNGVAHALGSGLPGVESSINRSIYLFAHSTSAPSLVAQYNAQFYLLHKLEAGDEIEIVFWNKSYKYRVTDKKTVAADDTSFLTPQTEKELLILATCTPPGTTWKRLIIMAERI